MTSRLAISGGNSGKNDLGETVSRQKSLLVVSYWHEVARFDCIFRGDLQR